MGDWRWPICQLQDFYSCLHVPEYHNTSWEVSTSKMVSSSYQLKCHMLGCLGHFSVLVIFLTNLICTSSKAWARRTPLQSRHENVTGSRIGDSDVFPCFTSSWTWGKKALPRYHHFNPPQSSTSPLKSPLVMSDTQKSSNLPGWLRGKMGCSLGLIIWFPLK